MEDKEPTQFPSRYDINEVVQINFGSGRYIKEAIVKGVRFVEGKLYYDIAFNYDINSIFYLSDLDSCLVEDYNQQEPNIFGSVKDVKREIDKHLETQPSVDLETIERLNKLLE